MFTFSRLSTVAKRGSNCCGVAALALAVSVGMLLLPAQAWGQTVNITADRDNTLYQDTQGDISSGASTNFIAGRTNESAGTPSGFNRRGLVHFDLSSIPAGSTITAVTLTLYMNQASGSLPAGDTTTIGVHKVLATWGEGTSTGNGNGGAATTNDATWIHRFYPGTNWTTAGGQFTAAASDTTSVNTTVGAKTWTSATMVADVQGWLNTPSTNHGWLVKGDESQAHTARRFSSRENATASQRPKLTVTYTAPTGACCDNGSCSVITQAACTSAGGTYQGNGTDCSPNPCPPATGACCTNNVCSIQTQAACESGDGTYMGNGTDCTPDPCAAGTTVTLGANLDNTLYQEDANLSNALGGTLVLQSGGVAGVRRRSVISFDTSSIPTNATVTAATLRLDLRETSSTGGITAVVHKLTSTFGEGTSNAAGDETDGAAATSGDATWSDRFWPFTNWTTAGGDFISTISASTVVGPDLGFYEWSSNQLKADVQSWITTPSQNRGFMVKLSSSNEASLFLVRLRFYSRNNTVFPSSLFRPQLVITYTLPPPTGACCDMLGGCVVMTQANCTAAGGTYSGDNTVCSPNPCPPPTGACCFNSGTCSILSEAACGAASGNYQGNFTDCGTANCPLILTPFVDALPIPPIAQPTTVGGTHYAISMNEFYHNYHQDLPETQTWGYNSMTPGPTFVATRGTPITVRWRNNLRNLAIAGSPLRTTHILNVDTCLHGPDSTGQVPVTVVHFHGGKVDPVSDGNPDDAFAPGQTSPTYVYPNDQRASTLWYHDHALGITRLNVQMGLAGAYVLKDPAEDSLNLPSGEFDVPLIIQDRDFNPDGSVKYNAQFADAFFGKFMMVNGKVWPFMNVKIGKYRFRMVNGCNTRTLTLGIAGSAPMTLIATEQGLLSAPLPINSITLSPGERADVVINFNNTRLGAVVTLINTAQAPFPTGVPENDLNTVMQFRVQNVIGHTAALPATLVPVVPIPPASAVATRTFSLRNLADPLCSHGLWLINELMWHDVTDFPRVGSTEIWEFVNRSAITHPMHVHLVSFQVLNRQNFTIVNNQVVLQGSPIPPPPEEAGWKDTVQAHPNQVTRVIMKFEGFHGLYPMHCHILEHEDHEMMRQFDVLCDAPIITGPPQPVSAPVGGTANFSVTATGDALTYVWTRDGNQLFDGPTGSGSVISGATTANLTISNVQFSDEGMIGCRVINPCGTQGSEIALDVNNCPQDFNQDGNVDPDDLGDFINCYFAVPPCPQADFNNDGNVDPDDLGDFINVYFGPPCV